MSELAKCPMCGSEREHAPYYNKVVAWTCSKCCFTCNTEDLPRIKAAMEFAKATRTLEDVMEPLNSGKLKMGQALPAIRLAMEDQNACEQRVLEVFK